MKKKKTSRKFGSNIFDRMRRFAKKHPGRAWHALAAAFLRDLGLPEPWRSDCSPIFVRMFAHVLREEVRLTERAMPPKWRDAWAADVPLDILEVRRSLCRQPFKVGDRLVDWGAATIADHQSRITFLRRNIQHCEETIRGHEQAIALIRERNVSCLDELDPDATAA